MNLLEAIMRQRAEQGRANATPARPIPANVAPADLPRALLGALPTPIRQALPALAPLAQTLPGVGALGAPVGQAVASATAPVGAANAAMLLQRIGEQVQAQYEDRLPNPLPVGPRELRYNPLRDVPVVGGAINATVNAPLHALGLTGEVAGKVANTAAGEVALLAAAAQHASAQLPGADPNASANVAARQILDEGWQYPGRALHAARTGPDTGTALLAGAAEIAFDPRNYAAPIGRAGAALEAGGTVPTIGTALKNTAIVGEIANRLPLAPLAAIPRARRALTELPDYARPIGQAAANATPAIADLLTGGARRTGERLPDGRPPLPPRATLPDLGAPPPPPVQIPLRAELPRLRREEIETQLLMGGRTPATEGIRDAIEAQFVTGGRMPRPYPTRQAPDVNARVADYLNRARRPVDPLVAIAEQQARAGRPNPLASTPAPTTPANLPPLLAGLAHQIDTPAMSNPLTPGLVGSAGQTIPTDLQQRVLGMAVLKGGTPTASEIQRELQVGAGLAFDLRDFAANGAIGTPSPAVGGAATPGAIGGPAGAMDAAATATGAYTSRADWLDTLTGMPASDKALLLRDLLNANYGGGAKNALTRVLGQGYVPDEQAPQVIDWLIQRTAEDPRALAKLTTINPPLASAIPGVEPAAATATELQNAIRSGLGIAPKGAPTINPAQAALPTAGGLVDDAVDDVSTLASDLIAGIEDAVRRGDVDEAEALVALAPEYGVPANRARAVLEAAADAGGSYGLADTQRQAIEASPYFAAFKHFNRDGALKKVNPRTGAPLLVREGGRLTQGRAEVWNIPGSGYDEVAAAAMQDFGGYHPQWATDADEYWTQAREAFRQYQQLQGGTPIDPADFVGDWAGGGGGIVAHPNGLIGFTGQATGAIGGAVAGGAIGATQGGQGPEDRLHNAMLGAATGAAIGGNLGSAYPQLKRATQVAFDRGLGIAESSAFTPTVIDAAIDNGVEAMRKAAQQKGVRLADLPAALDNQWRSHITATFRNWQQDAANLAGLAREFGREFGASTADVDAMRMQLADNLRNPDPVARYGQLGAQLRAVGLDRLIDKQKGLSDLLGVGQIVEATSKAGQLSTPQRIAAGAAFGWGSSLTKVSPLAPAFGAARGYLEPFIQGVFGTINRLQHDAPRTAFLAKALDRDLPILADEFLSGLQAQGANVSALTARGGYFTPQEVAQIAGAKAGQEWAIVTEGITRLRADRIASLFGDFRDKGAQATTADKAIGVVGRVFPFASWGLRYAGTLAEVAARHPIAAEGLVGFLWQEAQRAKREKRPGYQVGTIPITDDTPLVGGLVRGRLGGAEGEQRLNPLSLLTGPYGGDLLSGVDELPEDATGYQRAKAYVSPLGLSPHPLIQAAAYATGQDYAPPGSLSRTAGAEGLATLLPGPLGSTIPSGRTVLDAARGVIEPAVEKAGIPTTGASAYDPIARRYAELVLTRTKKPLSDPANVRYYEAMYREGNPLWAQAKREATLAAGAGTALSFGVGLPTSAQTAEAVAARQAGKLPYSSYEISQAPKARQSLMLAANQNAITANPASATYADLSPAARKARLMEEWDKRNQFVKRNAPKLYAERRKEYEKSVTGGR